ncbi:hypothetical protein GCM10010304_04620 [Streptomyces roseoviolaceus]
MKKAVASAGVAGGTRRAALIWVLVMAWTLCSRPFPQNPRSTVLLALRRGLRLRYPTDNYKPFHDLLDTTPEIVEAHHVTGEDCFVLKVVARSMRDLERTTGRIAALGSVATSVVYSSPLPSRSITTVVSQEPSGGSGD